MMCGIPYVCSRGTVSRLPFAKKKPLTYKPHAEKVSAGENTKKDRIPQL